MRNRQETSKIFLFIITFLSIFIIIVSTAIAVRIQSTDVFCYSIPAIFGELGAATAGYYWKSKNENKIKITVGAVKEIIKFDNLDENQVKLVEALINTMS